MIFKGYQYEMNSYLKHLIREDYQGHVRTYSKKEIKMFLENTNFKIKEHHYNTFNVNTNNINIWVKRQDKK